MGDTRPLLVKVQLVQSLWKAMWRFLRKMGLDLPSRSSYPTLGHIPKGRFLYLTTETPALCLLLLSLFITAQTENGLDAHQ